MLGINNDPVTIKQIELADHRPGLGRGLDRPRAAEGADRQERGGRRLRPGRPRRRPAARRAGHAVTVFERADRIGGLLRYGIPDFKMEKRALDRRLDQMEAEGVRFKPGVNVGVDVAPSACATSSTRCFCGGARRPATCRSPAASSTASTSPWTSSRSRTGACAGDAIPDADFITAQDKHVIIIGGGDTGADCLGTVHRQGARVHQFEIVPRPPDQRAPDNPWPQWSNVFRVSSAHEEGGEREYAITTKRFVGESGRRDGLETVRVEMRARRRPAGFVEIPGTEHTIPADLVLLAMGFVGPERQGHARGARRRAHRARQRQADAEQADERPGVFTAGDMTRGQSLIVWAIAEGRNAAHGVDQYLMGHSDLPAPLA